MILCYQQGFLMLEQLIQQIGREMEQCPICCMNVEGMYSISNCSHRCCEDCLIGHISARLENFSELKCIDPSCKKTFTMSSPIARKLSQQVLKKYRKYQNYKHLSNNPHLRLCKNSSCEGVMNRSNRERKCPQCKTEHCAKCYEVMHTGTCNVDNDILMMNLNFRRCPKCRAWVEKNGGCQYLDCKCGMMFCFSCGVEFQYDPCRKSQFREQETEVRSILDTMALPEASSCLAKICFIPKLILKLVLFILLTSVGCGLAIALTFGLLLPLIVGFSPLMIFILWRANDSERKCCSVSCVLGFFVILIFYPLISALVGLAVIGIVLSYPIGRILYPARLYDGLDMIMTYSALYYLRMVKVIVQF